ncbi:MAG: ABC transporter ATP-binding protein [Candidatus Sumerlaeaceae bacterium]|nr:ABC transporter ATP-binding protein [Candidatus Sumerlaeaceae bacterium]
MTADHKPIVLRVKGLTKKFGQTLAVNNISFDVHDGDIFGFLGPNGAGKSTTMYTMSGLVAPTSGSIEIFGHPHTDFVAVRSRMGAMIEVPAFYEYLSGRKNLEVLARLQPGIAPGRVDDLLDKVGLLSRAKDRVGEYSHGMKQRLGIAQALLNSPQLLLLDEPTSGLDPEGSAQIWELLRRLVAEEHMTIFISSHLLHEVEENCNRIAVINQGIIVACDQVRHLLFFSKEDYLLLFDTDEHRAGAEKILRQSEGVEILPTGGEAGTPGILQPGEAGLWIRVQQGLASKIVGGLVEKGLAPKAFSPQRKTLKQFFLELTRRQPAGRA